MKLFKQKNKAFTLVETLVAISIFTVSILGLISVLASGISDIGYAKKKITATYLAQEGIEYTRNFRDNSVLFDLNGVDNGWGEFENNFTGDLLPQPEDSSFERTIELFTINASVIKVLSTVSWTQGTGEHSVAFSEILFKWAE